MASIYERVERRLARREEKEYRFEGNTAQHKYTLNGVTAVEHVEIERRKKVRATNLFIILEPYLFIALVFQKAG